MKAPATLFAIALLGLVSPTATSGQLVPVDPNCQYFVDINILNQFSPAAQACAGAFKGNDKHYATEIAQLIESSGWGDNAQYLGTTDSGSGQGPFSSVANGPNGTIVFDSPLTGSYVFVLKAANKFSLYYFANLAGATQLTYTTLGTSLNPRDAPQGLSHASLWSTRRVSVPEPGSGLLLGAAFMALLAVARRRGDLG